MTSSLIEAAKADRGLIKSLNPDPIEADSKKDWVKITAIVVLILSGIVTAFAGLCLTGTFPPDLLGGMTGVLITLSVGGGIALTSGSVVFYKWKPEFCKEILSGVKDFFIGCLTCNC